MSKIGLILSMIGGILFFILMYIFARHYYSMWSLGGDFVYGFLFFIFIYGGAIVGAFLGLIANIWQIGKNWQMRLVKVGRISCFLAGIGYPLWMLSNFLVNPSTFFIGFFESFLDAFYHTIPMLILFIGGITCIIEWQLELRKL